jgi:hypothetical protein
VSSDTHERPESGSITEASFGDVGVDVVAYASERDGAAVIEIEGAGRLRVLVNEGVVFDQDTEEFNVHGECGYVFRTASGAHRCGIAGVHLGRPHVCGGMMRGRLCGEPESV